jgi:hypothetical protein
MNYSILKYSCIAIVSAMLVTGGTSNAFSKSLAVSSAALADPCGGTVLAVADFASADEIKKVNCGDQANACDALRQLLTFCNSNPGKIIECDKDYWSPSQKKNINVMTRCAKATAIE